MGFVLLAIADIACVLDLAAQMAATLTCFQLTCSKKNKLGNASKRIVRVAMQSTPFKTELYMHDFECAYYSHDYTTHV